MEEEGPQRDKQMSPTTNRKSFRHHACKRMFGGSDFAGGGDAVASLTPHGKAFYNAHVLELDVLL